MTLHQHLELDKQTGMVDVQILDVLSEIESLLRNAREIQRQILRVRGVPKPQSMARRRAASAIIRKVAREMSKDSLALSRILGELGRATDTLRQSTGNPARVASIPTLGACPKNPNALLVGRVGPPKSLPQGLWAQPYSDPVGP
jgi:hypothetical protein